VIKKMNPSESLMSVIEEYNGIGDLVEMIKKILENGADPNYRDMHSSSALEISVEKGYYDVCEILLKFGANPDQYKHEKCDDLMKKHCCGDSRMRINVVKAIEEGFFDILKLLVENGADLNVGWSYYESFGSYKGEGYSALGTKYTPIEICVKKASKEKIDEYKMIFGFLLSNGCKLDAESCAIACEKFGKLFVDDLN